MIRRIGLLSLQLFVTAVGICYVLHDSARRAEVLDALRRADWHWLLLAWISYSLVETLATIRWQVLLRVQSVTIAWWRAGAIVMIGLFFNMFLPGLVGGDAMRLYFVFKEAPRQKMRATLAVAIDRLIGLVSLLLLVALVVVDRFKWLKQSPQTLHITYIALALLGGSALFLVFVASAVGLGWLNRLPKKFPLRATILESGRALRLYAARPWTCLAAVGLTMLSHLAYYFSYYCAMRSLHAAGNTAGLFDFICVMPLVNTITGVPVSLGGLGVRETLFQKLLGDLAGVPAAPAALSASLGYAVQASWGLLGGLAYLLVPFGKRRVTNRR
ncbi:MAG TPA: lysylphosphatidylglycerol synthase transmembrane domain-containing protein [Chthoniobacterales bacterium]|jgi:hypothetical protein